MWIVSVATSSQLKILISRMSENPYEVSRKAEFPRQHSSSYRWRSFLCVVVTAFGMIVAMIAISRFINLNYRPNMRTWVIPYFILIAVTCVPVGISAVFVGHALRGLALKAIPFILGLAVVFALVPIVMIQAFKGASISFAIQCLLLLLWTSGTPFFIGVLCQILLTFQIRPRSEPERSEKSRVTDSNT